MMIMMMMMTTTTTITTTTTTITQIIITMVVLQVVIIMMMVMMMKMITTTTTTTRRRRPTTTALKGAIRVFYNRVAAPQTVSKHTRSSGHGANVCLSRVTHPALIACDMSCAIWCEEVSRPLSLTEFKTHSF